MFCAGLLEDNQGTCALPDQDDGLLRTLLEHILGHMVELASKGFWGLQRPCFEPGLSHMPDSHLQVGVGLKGSILLLFRNLPQDQRKTNNEMIDSVQPKVPLGLGAKQNVPRAPSQMSPLPPALYWMNDSCNSVRQFETSFI